MVSVPHGCYLWTWQQQSESLDCVESCSTLHKLYSYSDCSQIVQKPLYKSYTAALYLSSNLPVCCQHWSHPPTRSIKRDNNNSCLPDTPQTHWILVQRHTFSVLKYDGRVHLWGQASIYRYSHSEETNSYEIKCLETKPFLYSFIQYYFILQYSSQAQLYLSPQTVHTLNMLNCEKYIILAMGYLPM